ncbi:beta-fibrinogenase brevinase-like [Palaemon carinicauda]|uniref:beta-fibrinogenase brevinase-like n=1 Tax=Palaemon carinicauda TaxID=392227 RepID=UPI0035B5BF93
MAAYRQITVLFFAIKVSHAIITNGVIYQPYPVMQNPAIGGTYPSLTNQAPCGSSVSVEFGMTYIIASPGYPNAYPSFSNCQWTFFTRMNQPLIIDCPMFQMQQSTQCSNGAFLALDPGDGQYLWYCGNTGPRNVASKTNGMRVFFWGFWQNTNNYKGFYCNIRVSSSVPSPGPSPIGGSCRCGIRQPRNRIIGGVETGINEFPWMALVKPPKGLCGGTLINENFVLTAAHCIDKSALPNNALPTVVLGEHRLSTQTESPYTITMQAKAVWPHERYNLDQGVSVKDFDIGLVELENPVSLTTTPFIAPACAPNPLKSYDDIPVTVTGWGYTSFPTGQQSDVLRKVELRTVPVSKCKQSYSSGIITNQMICAFSAGKDACFDDSGSPLMAQEGDNWVVIGVVSFGPESCAHPTISGVYTRVGDYIPWIQNKIGNSRTCPP